MEEPRHYVEDCGPAANGRGFLSDGANGPMPLARSATAIGRNADCSTRGRRPPMGSSASSRLQLRELREELQRGVMYAHRLERTSSYEAEEMAMTEELWASQPGGVEELEKRMQNGMSLRSTGGYGDDEEDNEEVAAFLGLTVSIPSNQGHSFAHQPLHPKAASFSGSRRTRMVPCSPPVPIPQKLGQRRNSISATSRTPSESFLIPTNDQQYSRSQCEARLWDEHWNYKLSLESRESFEASGSNQRDAEDAIRSLRSSSINRTHSPKPRTVSETSTDDTAGESCDDSGADPEVDVFAMDDL